MAFADTGKAIRRVSELLIDRLEELVKPVLDPGFRVTVGRPEPSDNGSHPEGARLNLFLYEAPFDPNLRNIPFDEGQPAPLWLVLKYLMTAFDRQDRSDSIEAHECLGEGIRALQKLSFLSLTDSTADALTDNPEALKITFDETTSDLLSKLMQGPDEKYRFSISFQVRPVMIMTDETPSYSLLVGVDYTETPHNIIGEDGIEIELLPSMGPEITDISPSKFEVNDTLTISGSNLNLSDLSVKLGSAELAAVAQQPDKLQCVVDGSIEGGGVISAGSHPISVAQTLSNGRQRASNLLIGDLLPTLDNAQFSPSANPDVYGEITMTGILLGGEEDDIIVALYQDGEIIRMFDDFTDYFEYLRDNSIESTQSELVLGIEETDDGSVVAPGEYRVILRVNGQQAKGSPQVEIVV